jgi:hypothetical protein
LNDGSGNLLTTVSTELINLNASPVAGVIGSLTYTTTSYELRLAQVNFESWSSYIQQHRPAIANLIPMSSPFGVNVPQGHASIRSNFVNDKKIASTSQSFSEEMKLYEFVRGYADEFFGKKFLVNLPFAFSAVDIETLKTHTSYDVNDAGYLPDGATPLGLSLLNQNVFSTKDGRFRAFSGFAIGPNPPTDLSKVSPNGTVIQLDVPSNPASSGTLFVASSVNNQILFAPTPMVVITLGAPVLDATQLLVGDASLYAAVLQMNPTEGAAIMKKNCLPFKIAPNARTPNAVAIPLKSNTLVYGPWLAAGAPGKVRVEFDSSLNPWTFNGYDNMNLAGNVRVATAITNQQVVETGTVEFAGSPTTSLGRLLQSGGPNVTSIDVAISSSSITTSYRFQTFTNRWGIFSKGYVERLKRLSLSTAELRKSIRLALKDNLADVEAIGNAARTSRDYLERMAKARKRETPHDVLHAWTEFDTIDNAVRQQISMATQEEAIQLSNAEVDEDYQATAIMSLSGLTRPFSTSDENNTYLPSYEGATLTGDIPSQTNLDPWVGQNDIECFSYGDTYTGVNAYINEGDNTNARVFGLRAPLVLVGWGYGTDGQKYPGSTDWDSDYLTRSDKWVVGPLDCLWDSGRAVWTVHDLIRGVTAGTLSAGGSATVTCATLSGQTYSRTVYNPFSTAVATGKKIIAGYIADFNRYEVVSADC